LSRFNGKYSPLIGGGLYIYEKAPGTFGTASREIQLKITDNTIREKIHQDCGHISKRIPRYVFGLSKRLLQILFDAMRKGDGTIRCHKTATDSYIYYTAQKELADDVQELAIMCGWETSLYGPYEVEEARFEENTSRYMYQVHVRKENLPTKKLTRFRNIKKIEVENERIVCFSVPNETLITRRNGQVAYQGNCKHAYHLIRLLRMGKEIISEAKVLVKRPDAQELLDIRNGKFSYEELVSYAENLKEEVNAAVASSPLPAKPNYDRAEALLTELVQAQLAK
jgi:hypothetical protein